MLQKGFQRQFMNFDIFKKAVDDCKDFNHKLKALIFAGHGEPLLHKEIAKMVDYAKAKDVADRVEIVTNGSLLTRELSDALIEAGLDRLRVSVQGVDADAYQRIMGKEFDFQGFVDALSYFYTHKKSTEVYCKIIDVAMESPVEEEKFHDIFDKVSDETAIEYEIPFVQEIDNASLKKTFDCSKQGNAVSGAKVCAMPFYMMVITPNGDVVPCCSTDVPIVLGNVQKESLQEIWECAKRKGFCRVHLLGNRGLHPVCSICSVPQFGMQTGDYLDEHAEELLKEYPVKWGESHER